jgi:3-mercaptopyruvate sulfurtransferase SseA
MTTPQGLAVTALLLGGLAGVAGTPYASAHGQIDVSELASVIVHEQDHVDAIDLARWIKERKSGLRVVDVRSAAEFDNYRVPTAENVPLDRIGTAGFVPTETIVLYSGGGAHGAQAWVLLRALGLRRVFFLSGGLDEWVNDVMSPTLPDDATADEKAAFQATADISRYFGGVPRNGPRVPVGAARGTDALSRLKRRGC